MNLLPWREQRLQRRIRHLQGGMLGVGLVALLVIWRVDACAREALLRQARDDATTRQVIEALDAQLEQLAQHKAAQEQIRDRVEVLEQLQAGRLSRVALLERLADAVPQGVYLTALTAQGQRLRLTGVADSGSLIAQLLRNLSSELGDADVHQIKAVDAGEAFELSLIARGAS
ncbi:PilN domain-containing protein [Pseudomonas sp. BJa5]|uniref:PilN domain-containing protein n=1 Tax=Pseudomonas sp. BJa5 TaxID=2936270 RepID=UPI002559ACE5|nr:PilN domain-containing protein [Pseudomonas sp. BGr12]MDL2421785.1 PilN domain-containing protein [Pseudomonas sp. BGr12]